MWVSSPSMAHSAILAHLRWIVSLMLLWLPYTDINIPEQDDIESSLGPLLSPAARIYFPGSADFSNLTASAAAKKPDFHAVVEVATQEDVVHTVHHLL